MLKCMPQNEDCSHYSTMFLHMLKVKTVQREKMVILDSKLGNSCFRRPSKFEDMVLCLKIRDLWNVIVFSLAKHENKDSEWINGNRGGRLDKLQKTWGNDLYNRMVFQKIKHPVLQNI